MQVFVHQKLLPESRRRRDTEEGPLSSHICCLSCFLMHRLKSERLLGSPSSSEGEGREGREVVGGERMTGQVWNLHTLLVALTIGVMSHAYCSGRLGECCWYISECDSWEYGQKSEIMWTTCICNDAGEGGNVACSGCHRLMLKHGCNVNNQLNRCGYFSHALLCCQTCMPAKQMCVNQLPWDQGFFPGKELIKSSRWSRKLWEIVLFFVSSLKFWRSEFHVSGWPRQKATGVSHRGLRAHPALSPSACLFWLGACNPTRGASVHGLCVSPVGLKEREKKKGKHGGDLRVVFPPVAFQEHSAARSCVAPNAPGPFSKAKRWNPRSQKRSKTISPSEWVNFHKTFWEEKNRNQIRSTLSKTLVKLFE